MNVFEQQVVPPCLFSVERVLVDSWEEITEQEPPVTGTISELRKLFALAVFLLE